MSIVIKQMWRHRAWLYSCKWTFLKSTCDSIIFLNCNFVPGQYPNPTSSALNCTTFNTRIYLILKVGLANLIQFFCFGVIKRKLNLVENVTISEFRRCLKLPPIIWVDRAIGTHLFSPALWLLYILMSQSTLILISRKWIGSWCHIFSNKKDWPVIKIKTFDMTGDGNIMLKVIVITIIHNNSMSLFISRYTYCSSSTKQHTSIIYCPEPKGPCGKPELSRLVTARGLNPIPTDPEAGMPTPRPNWLKVEVLFRWEILISVSF